MKPVRLLLFVAAVSLLSRELSHGQTTTTTHPYEGVTRIDVTETSPRPENIHILEINLTAPGIHFELSPQSPAGGPGGTTQGYANTTTTQQTLGFMNQVHAQLAINTEFFINTNGSAAVATPMFGFAASDGNVYSPFQSSNANTYAIVPNAPAINIDSANNAQVVTVGASSKTIAQSASVYNAVSGSAQIITNGVVTMPTYTESGGVLADGGGYSSSNSWYANNNLAARSAIGLSQNDKTLYLFTVDDAGGSQGMTVAEMAGFLQSNFGVYNALNLDGGGSTTMSWVNPSTGLSSDINVSSNSGGDRYVGASLAVFASPTPEPGTMTLLFAAAGGGIACVASRRRKTRQAREVIQDIRSQPMGSVKK